MADPYYTDDWLTVFCGDARAVMAEMPAESVHCVVTSPPYWGLRDYGTATWDGGDEACPHRVPATGSTQNKGNNDRTGTPFGGVCGVCGATRIDSQLGLEPTPEAYVANMVAVFREVRRVMRDDATLWLNLGDSYATDTAGWRKESWSAGGSGVKKRNGAPGGLKPKDLVGIPWRVAFALQADGWYLRSEIIWEKPNPMPEPVTDRPTKAHEQLFLLTKSARYFYDDVAVRENGVATDAHGQTGGGYGVTPPGQRPQQGNRGPVVVSTPIGTRNLRSVWTIATAPYKGAHFATFPPKLVEPCVKAGTSERGVCPECGAPWVRETEVVGRRQAHWQGTEQVKAKAAKGAHGVTSVIETGSYAVRETTGWKPTCTHVRCPVCYNTGDARTISGVPRVRQDVRSEGLPPADDVLLQDMFMPSDGQDEANHEGLRDLCEGLHPPLPSGPSDGDEDRLPSRAPSGDGRVPWADAPADRSGGSHQRDQERQSTREPARSDEEGARRSVEPGASQDGDMPRLREPLPAARSCGQCGADLQPLNPVPSVVLDCFAGSGTTGLVAQQLGRSAVLIDLSVEYLGQLMIRNNQTPLGLGA